MPVRVAVVSPSHLVRGGLVSLVSQLEAQALVTQASDNDNALGPHDVAIYDLSAVGTEGAYQNLPRLLDSEVPVIVLVHDTDRDAAPAAMEANVHVISYSVTPEELFKVLRRTTPARRAKRVLSPDMALPAGLSEREFRVVELIGAGLSNQQIGDELYLTINSIKTYIRQAYRKMGVSTRSAAILWAAQHGLSRGPDSD